MPYSGWRNFCLFSTIKHKKIQFFLFFLVNMLYSIRKTKRERMVQMISNRVVKDTIQGVQQITGIDMLVASVDGKTVATTKNSDTVDLNMIESFVESKDSYQEIDGEQYFKVLDGKRIEYVLILYSKDESAHNIGLMTVMQLENLLVAYKERFDKENFIKNLLLDNLLLIDIYNRAKKLHIDVDARRIVFLIEADVSPDKSLAETAKQMKESVDFDFITAVDEKSIVYVSTISQKDGQKEFLKKARKIKKQLKSEEFKNIKIAIGNEAANIKDVSRSYKEAQIAMEVSKIFYSDIDIITYEQLGIGRLIYQLPLPLCKMFISEVFGDYSPEKIDDEILATINKFFENNLNVSETSRQLFIHRNTLVYRLDKIQKNTNLDLRNFEDAIAFKIALMVVQYMKYMETVE